MEYIHGPDLLTFLQQKGKAWSVVLFLQLLNDLHKLHENGWVFGDLKPENLIVTGRAPKIRCIDVGGTTIQGRAIKEFTEFYDRGYWGLGTRKADPGYDLFAVAMIMINTAYPKRFNKTTGGITQLRAAIRKQRELLPLEKVMVKALEGRYSSALQMRSELLAMGIDKSPAKSDPSVASGSVNKVFHNGNKTPTRQTYRKKKKKSRWMETFAIATSLAFLYILYIFQKIL